MADELPKLTRMEILRAVYPSLDKVFNAQGEEVGFVLMAFPLEGTGMILIDSITNVAKDDILKIFKAQVSILEEAESYPVVCGNA